MVRKSAKRYTPRLSPLSRFGWLMELYAENYTHFLQLFSQAPLTVGEYCLRGDDGLTLFVDVLACHSYTVELRMTYPLIDPLTGQLDPSAYVRVYHDARQVEATHCYIGRSWQDAIGLYPPPALLIHHRLRMNIFLGKWLDYLWERGYGRHCLQVRQQPLDVVVRAGLNTGHR